MFYELKTSMADRDNLDRKAWQDGYQDAQAQYPHLIHEEKLKDYSNGQALSFLFDGSEGDKTDDPEEFLARYTDEYAKGYASYIKEKMSGGFTFTKVPPQKITASNLREQLLRYFHGIDKSFGPPICYMVKAEVKPEQIQIVYFPNVIRIGISSGAAAQWTTVIYSAEESIDCSLNRPEEWEERV